MIRGNFNNISINATIFRLQTFLELPEYEHSTDQSSDSPTGLVRIDNACMAWEVLTQKPNKEEKMKTGMIISISIELQELLIYRCTSFTKCLIIQYLSPYFRPFERKQSKMMKT